ncbi:MAG: hypothetical protein ACK5G9_13865, partial [Akkermansiaceae bacterium]
IYKIMKAFIKLIAAITVFGFAAANAAYTPDQTAAVKAVTDAVATGDESTIKDAVSKQVASFPEITGAIVSAALNVPNTSTLIKKLIVRYAVIAAPGERSSILMAIDGNKSLAKVLKITLTALVSQTIKEQLDWKVRENYVKPPSVS